MCVGAGEAHGEGWGRVIVRACVRVYRCVYACVRACVRVYTCVCVRACVPFFLGRLFPPTKAPFLTCLPAFVCLSPCVPPPLCASSLACLPPCVPALLCVVRQAAEEDEEVERLTRELYDSLRGGREAVAVAAFLAWETVASLRAEGALDDARLTGLLLEVREGERGVRERGQG